MSYQDLPPNWSQLPLLNPAHAANVVDLVMAERDRDHNSVLLLLCTCDGVPMPPPIMISDVEWDQGPEPLIELWSHVSQGFGCNTLLLASSHAQSGQPARHKAWLDQAAAGFSKLGTTVIGRYTAARDTVHLSR